VLDRGPPHRPVLAKGIAVRDAPIMPTVIHPRGGFLHLDQQKTPSQIDLPFLLSCENRVAIAHMFE
jgi:hypothetical protein